MSAQQLTLTEAQDLVNAWRNLSDTDKGTAMSGLKAWLIPHAAVSDLIDDAPHAIRTYLGYDSDNDEVKLVIVGTDLVNGVEEDIIETAPDTKIYDYTQPCPTNCDANSPLN